MDGRSNFVNVQSRRDVELLMMDLSTDKDDYRRKKKDPVPKFFLKCCTGG